MFQVHIKRNAMRSFSNSKFVNEAVIIPGLYDVNVVLFLGVFFVHTERLPVLTGYGVVLASDWMTGSTRRTGSQSFCSSSSSSRLFLDVHWAGLTACTADLFLLFSVVIHFPFPFCPSFCTSLFLSPTSCFLCLLLDSTSLSFSDLWSALSWFHYELAEQVKPTGFWESVEPECRPLQPLHCRPRDLSHGVWKPLETGELKTHTVFFSVSFLSKALVSCLSFILVCFYPSLGPISWSTIHLKKVKGTCNPWKNY